MKLVAHAASAVVLLCAACGPGASITDDGGGPGGDGGVPEVCTPSFDEDADGIRNGIEGCELDPPRDTDGDGTPDWLDDDSDNDGVEDQYEDRNGDGVIGSCTNSCLDTSMCPAGWYCARAEDGVGIGYCVSWECLDGETDPHGDDTDGDGTADVSEGTWVCNPTTEDNPMGLKAVKYVDSAGAITYSNPNWKIALETYANEGAIAVANPATYDSAFLFDYVDPDKAAAGFLVTRAATPAEVDAVVAAEQAVARLGAVGQVTIRAAGTRNPSLDGYDTILETTLIVTAPAMTDVTALRAAVVPALMGRPPADFTFPPVGWSGTAATQFVVVFQSEWRADVNETLFMGAVARLADFEDPDKATGFHVGDLANGTGLTHSGNGDTIECEQWKVAEVPRADIIWVLDESGSMDDDRANVATNATSFFQKAVLAGLDFRVGVTDMHNGREGRFAQRAGGTSTGDRWLLPGELALFQNNVNDPSGPDPGDGGTENGLIQGRDAVELHLPRGGGDAAKLRSDAKLVVIYVTDEHAEEVEEAGIISEGGGVATPAQKAAITALAQPYIQVLQDNDGIAHLIAIPESDPTCSGGGGEIGYGYFDLVNALGGQFGSICQADLGATMDAIIDDISGSASPIVLEWVPISATIAVTRDNVYVPRSRSFGWDYRASSNSIVFYNMPFDPLSPSDIVISYRRWEEQVPIE